MIGQLNMKPLTLLLLFLSLMCSTHLHAQSPCDNSQFVQQFSNGENNYIYKIISTTDGGILMAGGVRDFLNANSDALLIKVNQAGTIEWSKTIGINNNADQFFNVIQTSDGGFMAIGQSRTTPYETAIVCKLSASGNISWSKGYPAFSYNLSHKAEIVELPSGGFALSAIYSLPLQRSFVLRIDNSGGIVWGKTYTTGGTMISNANSLALQNDSLVISGFCQTSAVLQDQFRYITKVNIANGNVFWAKRWSNAGGDLFRDQVMFRNHFFTNHVFNGIEYVSMLDNNGAIAGTTRPTGLPFIGGINSLAATADTGVVIPKLGEPANPGGMTFGFVKIKNMAIESTKAVTIPPGNFVQHPVITVNNNGDYIAALMHSTSGSGRNIMLIKSSPYSAEPANSCGFYNPVVSFENASITSQTFTWPIIEDYGFAALDIPLVANDIAFINSAICTSTTTPTCTSLNLTGMDTVCLSGTTVQYKGLRAAGCNTAVQFSVDNTFAQVTASTDSTASILFLQEGTTRIHASLTTERGILKDSIDVVVKKHAESLQLGPDLSFCGTANFTLAAPSGFRHYVWQDGTTGTSHTASAAGIYHVTVTDFCDNISRDSVIITETLPEQIELGNDQWICKGDTVTIAGPAGFANYSWSPGINIVSLHTQHATVFPQADTKYYLHAEKTAGSGCISVDSITIRIHPVNNIRLRSDTSICEGSMILLDAGTGFVQYDWNTGSHSQTIIVSQQGAYIINASDANGCKATDTFRLYNVFSKPVINLSKDSVLCAGSTKILDAGSGPGRSFIWQDASTLQHYTVSDTGFYMISVTDANGCINKDSVHINTLSGTPANFLTKDTSLCFPASLLLSPSKIFDSYLWSNTSSARTITISQPGIYWLQVTDSLNCEGIDSVLISEKNCANVVYFPNSFTPNYDGKNDLFRPWMTGNPERYLLLIYNRYGELVFRSENPRAGWNGAVKGRLQDTGTFTWFCQYRFAGGQMEDRKGTITLIR